MFKRIIELKKNKSLVNKLVINNFYKSSVIVEQNKNKLKTFESIKGPKPLPLIGNIWRYLPLIGIYLLIIS
jgi:hypothetical protein